MKAYMALAMALSACMAADAQYWRALGKGTIGPTEVQTLFGDVATDRLLAGGTFMWIRNEHDTLLGIGQAAWNGTQWDSVATRIQRGNIPNSVQQTFWFLRFQEQLFACGAFAFSTGDGQGNSSMARLNEATEKWEPLSCPVPNSASINTLVPKLPDTALYATGRYTELCGLPENCVFRFDGTEFHPWAPFDQIPYYDDNLVGFVFDFRGMTYITGFFRDPLSEGYACFLRWNGTSWEYVPGWGTYYGPIKEILVHDDILYVGGAFRMDNGGPGNGVASFDGEQWNSLGGGVLNTAMPGNTAVLGLQWFHDELVVCGRFMEAAGVPCSSIAKWDGQHWCSYPGELRAYWGHHPTLYELAVWRDSLYVCGTVLTVDGDTMQQVLQWTGGDAVGGCSTVGLSEAAAPLAQLQAAPLPGGGQWRITFPQQGNWHLAAYNTAGQVVGRWDTGGNSMVINLGPAPPGLYFLRAISTNKQQLATKVLRP